MKSQSFDYTRPLGWILTTVSLLGLIQDAGAVALKGKLLAWMNAYQYLAKSIGNFLFGWIHWKWMSVSTIEVHILILSVVVTSIWVRASMAEQGGKPNREALAILIVPLWIIIFSIILPDKFSVPVTGLFVGGLLLTLYRIDTPDADAIAPSLPFVWTETAAVLCLFLIVVFANSYFM